jgi:hypothetical protein
MIGRDARSVIRSSVLAELGVRCSPKAKVVGGGGGGLQGVGGGGGIIGRDVR